MRTEGGSDILSIDIERCCSCKSRRVELHLEESSTSDLYFVFGVCLGCGYKVVEICSGGCPEALRNRESEMAEHVVRQDMSSPITREEASEMQMDIAEGIFPWELILSGRKTKKD